MKISVDGTTYEYDPGKLMLSEARQLQAATGQTLAQWQRGLTELDADSVAGLVWLLRRRAGENGLQYADVEFDLGSFEANDDADPPTSDADTSGST